jgi:MATE family multidrug resistance protein
MSDQKDAAAASRRWQHGWAGAAGAREVLVVSYPLILSNLSFTLETFLDRLFLTWYSAEAVAGAVAGLFATWALIALFIGTGEYLTTFVAQYTGAGRPRRIGPAIWQGIYFSLLAGVLVAALSPLAEPVFAAVGHEAVVQDHEVTYSRILLWGAFPTVLMATLSTFFSGRGQTRVVLIVSVAAAVVDTVLNYLWIFGKGGFPRAGVAGAAWSTVVSQVVGALLYLAIIFRPSFRAEFATLSGWRLEPDLLRRLLRFGLPTGLQYSLEVMAFAIFMMIVGRLGTAELAASGIAFSLNMIVFMPMVGLGIGVTSLVGRYLGAGKPQLAERTTWSALWVSLLYMVACGLAYVFAPLALLSPYAAGADPEEFARVSAIAVVLLRFVALYSIFDMMNVIFASGLRGAGDTTYPMAVSIGMSWVVMILPSYAACTWFGAGPYVAWTAATAYVVLLGIVMLRRFQDGRWKTMRVIEEPHAPGLAGIAHAAPP